MNTDYEVFISYRHKDCNPLAKALHDRLLYNHRINAFRDDEGLHFGDFRKQLIKNNKRSRFLMLLLTPETLTRCHEEGDWITKEISLFLRRGKPIIPVKIGGFDFTEDMLPEKIRGLMKYRDKCIVCPYTEPEKAAEFIANESLRFLRRGWSNEMIREAVREQKFLSNENTESDGYFYLSAHLFRKNFVLFALHTLCVIAPFIFLSWPQDFVQSQFALFIFPLLSLWIFVLERGDGIDTFLDFSVIESFKATPPLCYLLLIPFALGVFIIPFVSLLLSACLSALFDVINGTTTSVNMNAIMPLTTYIIITGFPFVRMLVKTVSYTLNIGVS